MSDNSSESRRRFLKQSGGLLAMAAFLPAEILAAPKTVIRKSIPKTGEKLPVIGMGTSRTFDVSSDAEIRKRLLQVVSEFFRAGGALIDSSPMYGNAEEVTGDLLAQLPDRKNLFAATKVWTDGKQAGIEQMQQSMKYMRVKQFDLMQIHNLRDWEVHLETLKTWKQQKKIRYIGITTSHGRFHSRLEKILQKEDFDFLQLTYNIGNREVERKLLPIALERKIAVIVNRPFQRGDLFRWARGKKLPAWCADFDCTSWGQFFLKYVVSHPAVTCAIPATSKPKHMRDNMGANFGRLPDAAMRARMEKFFRTGG